MNVQILADPLFFWVLLEGTGRKWGLIVGAFGSLGRCGLNGRPCSSVNLKQEVTLLIWKTMKHRTWVQAKLLLTSVVILVVVVIVVVVVLVRTGWHLCNDQKKNKCAVKVNATAGHRPRKSHFFYPPFLTTIWLLLFSFIDVQDKSKWIQGNTPGTVSAECSPRGEITQKHAGQVFCSAWLKECVFISGRWLVVFNLPARHQMSLLCRYCFTRGRWWSSNRMFAQLRCPVWAAACTGQHKGRLCFYFTWCGLPAPPLSFIFWWALMYAIPSQGCFFLR